MSARRTVNPVLNDEITHFSLRSVEILKHDIIFIRRKDWRVHLPLASTIFEMRAVARADGSRPRSVATVK